jgi:hypothetical protein
MPKYKVEFPLIYKKKKYMPGGDDGDDTVTMSEKLAEPLLKKGALSSLDSSPPAAITEEAIVAAITKLDVMNAALWTGDGKPTTEALVEILNGKVSAKERDAAWERYQKETE